eukprot:5651302-Amphidinium_carterae.1
MASSIVDSMICMIGLQRLRGEAALARSIQPERARRGRSSCEAAQMPRKSCLQSQVIHWVLPFLQDAALHA